jgi:hypothetical protein
MWSGGDKSGESLSQKRLRCHPFHSGIPGEAQLAETVLEVALPLKVILFFWLAIHKKILT